MKKQLDIDNRGTCAKRVNQYGSHVGFCDKHTILKIDKQTILKMLVMVIYSRSHGSEKKKVQQHDDYGM